MEDLVNVIEVDKLKFWYSKSDQNEVAKSVLEDINLNIKQGEFVAVIGHNGSGKSTLAKHFNSILLPVEGKVYSYGMDTSDPKHMIPIRQRVGMVFQNPDNQLVASIVEEDVAFAPENLGVPTAEIRRRVDEALKLVGMYEFRHHAPHQLSGGQKQRVAIAGIIAMNPSCIVLDEPTAMLDPNGRREVLATVKRLNREKGVTVILITHFMNEAIQADRIVVMNKGEICLDDTPREVFRNIDFIKGIGLDVPQTTDFVYQLSKEGIPVKTDVLTIDECVESLLSLLKENHSADH